MADLIDQIVPLAFFATIVAIVWIIFSHRRANRSDHHLSQADQASMERMIGLLEKMEGRIITLEKILDAEDPRWREKVPPTQHL